MEKVNGFRLGWLIKCVIFERGKKMIVADYF